SQARVDFQTLSGYKGADVLNFGAETVPSTAPYHPENIGDFTILTSDALPKLDDACKKQLWQALKGMYGV
ncbi:MAG: hypothetical protein HC859_05375, partial [Bacteroidia bacterium]|nr:hypothetical protein [Bacteroidia bacterium]